MKIERRRRTLGLGFRVADFFSRLSAEMALPRGLSVHLPPHESNEEEGETVFVETSPKVGEWSDEAGPSQDESFEGSDGCFQEKDMDMTFMIKEALLDMTLNEQRLFAEESQTFNAATSELLNAHHRLEKETQMIRESLIQLDIQERSLQQSLVRSREQFELIKGASTPEEITILLHYFHQRAQDEMKLALHTSPIQSSIIMSKDGRSVHAGTLNDLVAFLTHQVFYSSRFTSAFLLTYKSFTTPELFFQQLLDRWYLSEEALEEIIEQTSTFDLLPASMRQDLLPFISSDLRRKRKTTMLKSMCSLAHSLKERVRGRIRLRVIAVLRLWLCENWSDFERCSTITFLFIRWLQAQNMEGLSSPYEKGLANLGQTFMRKIFRTGNEKIHTIDPSKVPPSILPKDFLKFPAPDLMDFFSFDPLEMARQISISEQKIFQAIESRELLNRNWNKANKTIVAPNVSALSNRVNNMASWVMNSIICCHRLKSRTKCLSTWIKIAQACKELGNLNGVVEILSGLGGSSVCRLRRTWELLDIKLLTLYEEMKSIHLDGASYRAYLRSLSLPCVPYIGFVLTDLTFTDERMPDYLDEKKVIINFQKHQHIASLVEHILHYQQVSYSLLEVGIIQTVLHDVWLDTSKHHSQEVLHAISKVIEP